MSSDDHPRLPASREHQGVCPVTVFASHPNNRDPRLGREYVSDLHRAPTVDDARMWSQGAKAALRFALGLAGKAQGTGAGHEELVRRLEGAMAVLTTLNRYGHEFETALIVDPSGDETCWLAWTIGPREETAM